MEGLSRAREAVAFGELHVEKALVLKRARSSDREGAGDDRRGMRSRYLDLLNLADNARIRSCREASLLGEELAWSRLACQAPNLLAT